MQNKNYYRDLYDRVGKRIGWDFSCVKKTEEGKGWDFFQEVLKKIRLKDTLLDVGTGGGEKVLMVASRVGFIYGIDHSENMIGTAEKNLKNSGYKNVKFLLMDSTKLEFSNETFNVVTDRHCDFVAKEVYRVLKKGGYFFTQQVSEGDQLNTKKAFGRGQAYGIKDGTLKNKYLRELKEAGFKNIKDFDYNSKVYFENDTDYLYVLRYTPTIPYFGKKEKDIKLFKDFVEKNRTKKGIQTNSKRFMIIAVK